MAAAEFPLPDVGEGLTEAEIVQWRVAIGDEIAVDQVLVEIETAKSLVELPSPFAGTVTGLLVSEGDTVEVGKPIIRVDSDASVASGAALTPPAGQPVEQPGGAAPVAETAPVSPVVAATPPAPAAPSAPVAQTPPAPARAAAPAPVAPAPAAAPVQPVAVDASVQGTDESSGAVLVGYGSATSSPSRRKPGARRAAALAAEASRASSVDTAAAAEASVDPGEESTAEAISALGSGSGRKQSAATNVLAKPPIRKLAKDLGVELTEIVATGLAGEVTRDDVIRHAKQASVFRNIETPEWGEVRSETIPVKGVRKAIATAMTTSAFTAPHVSLFVDVDATHTMEFVKRLKASPTFAGVKVSPLLIVAKAVIWAVRRNRSVNSTWTDREIIVHHFVNLGIAAATPRGLIVPNIKDAQDMSLLELAQALEELTLTARDGKTTPKQMANGTVSITNIGVFGMDTGTPILNPGEVAIVAMGTIKPKPWVVDGEVRSRMVTTIGASFDHRVVDGDVASRFVHDVASVLEEPALLLD
ncbi:2-oxo acid dehydrogenase subunit E2 [Curtobacterium flaccumfaciens]|uniref:Dihydrolipoamide acetyltransferase component of pyruvate dehydrogenase complex n=1 Tax=Curtobacterium poinsettiae TaxID=159612 RepID=A0A9Q9T4K5_9MICO|nr:MULTISPECIES: dihydrolipoamide acetyltransferase family protein [Curtobacterium]MCS6563484.1 2-oxo acid dehydrogenase subunit E2 [Curtobacterium flaccumfaciens pv. poinsettiae]UXN26927.1 2-oxo acid dehydrogenase subunit E2 [Curtobacterium flaccumfaciens]UXN29562.1 2-oxo acid dehydrogenase subunit E2 [Curtobacterium flaccumfaciens]UYC81769.1 2-oxo acid dehydrogenase subunit E2 [Curtobacterium flaccumfaciens pv. poinsettiae]